MRKSLIAVAIAGSLAAGAAGAQGTILRTPDHAPGVAGTHVQYYEGQRWQAQYQDVRSTPEIDDREARIAERIERGLESGRLTRREARRIGRELEDVRAKERAFVADGRLERWEERRLMRDLDRVAMDLRSQLRDEDRRY